MPLGTPAVPGIYLKSDSKSIPRIGISKRVVAGFVGVAEKGPIHTPIKIESFKAFMDTFGGFQSLGVLAYSVYGFFNSGGTECVVVRAASTNEEGGAAPASLRIKNNQEQDLFQIEAKSPGNWGNFINFRLWFGVEKSFEVLEFDPKAACVRLRPRIDMQSSARPPSIGNIFTLQDEESRSKKGDLIRFRNGNQEILAIIDRVEGETVYLESIEGLDDLANPEWYAEYVLINANVSLDQLSEDYLQVSFRPEHPRYFLDLINYRSQIVNLTKLQTEKALRSVPKEYGVSYLYSGRDGLLGLSAGDFIGHYGGPEDYRGMGCFEAYPEINVIAAPDAQIFYELADKETAERSLVAIHTALISQAESIPDRFALLDAPQSTGVLELLHYAQRYDSAMAALYYPNISILHPQDNQGVATVSIPPSGHIAGGFAKIDREKGVFYPPANFYIPGAVGLENKISDDEYEFLYPHGLNIMKSVPGRGIKVWGARTLSSDPQWRYTNVRRTFSRIATALKEGTRWAVFETNDLSLRKRLVRNVTGFLIDLWRDGYLAGSAEEAFFVRCNDELNPPENIDKGIVTVQVGLAIVKPTEFIVVTLSAEKENTNVLIE
jgi:hypothetical protein